MDGQFRDPDEPTSSHLRNVEETQRRLRQAAQCEGAPYVAERRVTLPESYRQGISLTALDTHFGDPEGYGNKPKPSRYLELIDEMVATHATKNRDYADSNTDPLRNFRRCEEVGIPAYMGCFIRMGDKFMRSENLLRRMRAGGDGPAVKNESIIDTLKDLAVYALIEIELIEQYLAAQGGVSE